MLNWLAIDPHWISDWAAMIIRGSLYGSAAIILVWIILRIFPKTHPTIHCWLWRIVYLRILISVLEIGPLQIPRWSLQKVFPSRLDKALYFDPVTLWAQHISQWVPATGTTDNLIFNASSNWLNFWFILWVLGVIAFGMRLIFLWFRSREASKKNYPVNHQVLERLYSEFCVQLGIHKPPRLQLSDSLDSPALRGLIHPEIILPAAILSQYRPHEIKLMLAHELAHLKRKDLFWNWLPAITRGLFFFHPLIWLAERQLNELSEICCDKLAVRFSGAGSADYGKVLVKAAIQPALSPKPGLAFTGSKNLSISRSKQILFKRLKALAAPGPDHPAWRLISFPILTLFGLAIILPWQLSPTVSFSVNFNNFNYYYSDTSDSLKDLTIAGNISDTAKVYLNTFEVVIDDQKITDGVTFNSYGRLRTNGFEGYLLVANSFNLKSPHRIRVFVSTSAGDFQRNYLVDFNDNHHWSNSL